MLPCSFLYKFLKEKVIMLKRLVFLALTLLLAIATIAPTVSAEEENGLDGLTKEQIEKF